MSVDVSLYEIVKNITTIHVAVVVVIAVVVMVLSKLRIQITTLLSVTSCVKAATRVGNLFPTSSPSASGLRPLAHRRPHEAKPVHPGDWMQVF